MKKLYHIRLNGQEIGTTEFEYADPPMGMVYGKINFRNINSPYKLFKEHCLKEGIKVSDDIPEQRLLRTMVIPELKIFNEKNLELMGSGAFVDGMDNDGYEIQLGGISTELMKKEFQHHYSNFYGK